MAYFSYVFWPRPPLIPYDDPRMQALLALGAVLVVASFALRWWRAGHTGMTRKLSRSWPRACLWFGLVALILAVSRAEDISYLSMRFLWVIWIGALLFYLWLQLRLFRARHYETLPRKERTDPREKYLPKPKR
jgi:hypothetical protein